MNAIETAGTRPAMTRSAEKLLTERQHVQPKPAPHDPEQSTVSKTSEIEVAAAAPWPPKRGTSATQSRRS